jgi:simple sugar transport system substrate-binding protein
MNIADYLSSMPLKRRNLFKSALTVTASTSVGATLLSACGTGNAAVNTSSNGNFPSHPKWKFVFVNHVTTNAFFTPTQYGIQDACALLGCDYQWTGSENSVVSEMVDAFNVAVSGKADGIAVALIDVNAFNAPVQRALSAGIPVVSYNADATGNARLAYIGQDLYQSGFQLGQRLAVVVPVWKPQ